MMIVSLQSINENTVISIGKYCPSLLAKTAVDTAIYVAAMPISEVVITLTYVVCLNLISIQNSFRQD